MTEHSRAGGEADERASRPNSKVARVIREYELPGLGDELVESWSDDSGDGRSLRELAEYVNHEILRSAMEAANLSLLDGEVENTYRLLTSEEVSSGMRTQAEASLERDDIDVEQLQSDFVSHQAVHTYLTKYRGVESPTSSSDQDQISNATEAVQQLKNRLVAVAEKNLRTLRKTDRLTLGRFNLFVDVRVFCNDCQTQYELVDLLASGGCDCPPDS